MDYTLLSIDYKKCSLQTMEGREFRIDPWDISITVGWIPTSTILFNKDNNFLQNKSNNQIVKLL